MSTLCKSVAMKPANSYHPIGIDIILYCCNMFFFLKTRAYWFNFSFACILGWTSVWASHSLLTDSKTALLTAGTTATLTLLPTVSICENVRLYLQQHFLTNSWSYPSYWSRARYVSGHSSRLGCSCCLSRSSLLLHLSVALTKVKHLAGEKRL